VVVHAPAFGSLRDFLLQRASIKLGLVKAMLSLPRYTATVSVGAVRALLLDHRRGARPRLALTVGALDVDVEVRTARSL
jgi:hypothetical protein